MNPSERMPVEVQAVSKEEVMELIEAEKRGDGTCTTKMPIASD